MTEALWMNQSSRFMTIANKKTTVVSVSLVFVLLFILFSDLDLAYLQ